MRCLHSREQQGHSALYTLLFLPLLLGFGSLAVDLSAHSSIANSLQSELDRITLSAAHALPSPEAKNIAESLIRERISLPEKEFRVEVSSAEVRTYLSAEQKSGLFPLIAAAFNGSASLRVSASSSAQLAPVDAVLILPDGPEMGFVSNDINFPASRAVSSCVHPPVSPFANQQVRYAELWQSDPEFVTSRCFNPLFSAVKELGVKVSEELIAIGTNRLGVIFNDSGEVIRSLAASGFQTHRASFIDEVELDTMFSDSLCALISSKTFGDTYTVRSRHVGCEDVVDSAPCGRPFYPGEGLSEECLSNSTVAEVIHNRFSRAVARSDLNASLLRAIAEITDSRDEERALQLRGNRGARPLRVIIAVVSTLPPPAPEIIATLRQHNIRVLLTVIREGDPFSAEWSALLEERVQHGPINQTLTHSILRQTREVVLKS
jgi:hypothetical protein